MIGALSVIVENGILDDVEAFVGSSVGAVISLLLVCGCSIHEIFELALHSTIMRPWKEMNKVDTVIGVDYGLVKHEKVTREILELVTRKQGDIPTLRELYERTGKRLVLVSGNLTDHCPSYIDYLSDPELRCTDPMTASMLVPGAISKFTLKGKLHIDGAFVDPYAACLLDDGETEILGITIIGTELAPETSWAAYMMACISLAFDRLQEMSAAACSDKVTTIELRLPEISVFDRGTDVNKRFRCYNAGVLEGMRAVAGFHGRSYEEHYGLSVMPRAYVPVPIHEVKRRRAQRGDVGEDGRAAGFGDRIARALGRIRVPRIPARASGQ